MAASALAKRHQLPSMSYDQYLDWCCDAATVHEWRTTLRLSPADTRLVLAAYAFRYYPHELISGVTAHDRQQVTAACRLLAVIEEVLAGEGGPERVERPDAAVTAPRLHEALATYRPLFRQWKDHDRLRVIRPFTEKYRQLRRLRTAPFDYYTRELTVLIDLTLLRLISDIMALAGEEGLATLDAPDTDEDEYRTADDLALAREYRTAAQTAFWADATLTSDYLVPLLQAFAQRYRALVPRRHDLHTALAELLDLEIIAQRLDRGTMSAADLLAYCQLLVRSSMELCVSVESGQAARDADEWARELTLWPPATGEAASAERAGETADTPHLTNEALLPLMQPFFTTLFQKMDAAITAAEALRG